MNAQENLQLQALEIKVAQLIQAISESHREAEQEERVQELPEWITLDRAAALKGGAAYETYNTKYWLQPCCGLKSRRIGGRKSWRREDVIEWLSVTDEGLYEYAKALGAKVPEKYKDILSASTEKAAAHERPSQRRNEGENTRILPSSRLLGRTQAESRTGERPR